MRKGIVLLLSLVMVFVMSAASFAADQEPAIIEDPIEEYSSEDGVEGYVSSKELAAEDDQNATIIEMRPGQRDVRFINLYSDRGEIIGKFRIETNCIALDDKEE